MRMQEILAEIAIEYHEPLIRVVGRNFPDTFLHGTAKKNIRSLAAISRPTSSIKQTGAALIDFIAPPEQNEFNAVMFLSDPRQPQQAHMFAQGRGNALAVVRLKTGTRVLDLSDEVTRAPMFGFGGPEILRFFSRPAITDALIAWQAGRIVQGYKERNPNWREKYAQWMDPASDNFRIQTWQETLVPYCIAHNIGAVRFADEILVTERTAIRDGRLANPTESEAAATTRTWPGARGAGLFTDQRTGAHDEASLVQEAVCHQRRITS